MSDEEVQEGWFNQGDDPEPEEATDRGFRKRFWIPYDNHDEAKNKRIITFVDDDPFRLYEHTVRIQGSYETFTCSQGAGEEYEPCPGCYAVPRNKRPRRDRLGYVTVIVETSFIAKDGTEVSNYRRLFPMKGKMLKIFLEKQKDRGGSMRGTRWKVWRTSDKSYSIGDDWSFLDRIEGISETTTFEEVAKILARHYDIKDRDGVAIPEVEKFDYMAMLKPDKPEINKQIMGMVDGVDVSTAGAPVGSEGGPGAPVGSKVDYK